MDVLLTSSPVMIRPDVDVA